MKSWCARDYNWNTDKYGLSMVTDQRSALNYFRVTSVWNKSITMSLAQAHLSNGRITATRNHQRRIRNNAPFSYIAIRGLAAVGKLPYVATRPTSATTRRTSLTTGRVASVDVKDDVMAAVVGKSAMSKRLIATYPHTKRVGPYLLGRTIGEGSFAKVKEGMHLLVGEKVGKMKFLLILNLLTFLFVVFVNVLSN